MKTLKIKFIWMLLILGTSMSAQQAAQYTQYNFDKLWFNPAYAGNHEAPAVQAVMRQQWMGFEGAPKSQSISFHSPFFKGRTGLGLMVDRDVVGPLNSWNITGSYAFRIVMPKGTLSIGLQASMNNFTVKYETLNTLTSDESLSNARMNQINPNFGTGIFYKSDKFFIGTSIPSLLRNSIEQGFNLSNSELMPLNMYLTGGVIFELSERLDIQPSVLIRYADNTPFDMDIHTSLIFLNKLYGGISYRLGGNGIGESLDFLFQYRFKNGFKMGVSYDYSLSNIQSHSNGSMELMLQYIIMPKNKNSKKHEELTNPRFF